MTINGVKKYLNQADSELDVKDNKTINNDIIKTKLNKISNIVKEVLKLKTYKNEIVDKKRISLILKNIKKKSIKSKIDPKITNRIWKNMIMSYIDFERRNFKKK